MVGTTLITYSPYDLNKCGHCLGFEKNDHPSRNLDLPCLRGEQCAKESNMAAAFGDGDVQSFWAQFEDNVAIVWIEGRAAVSLR